MPTDVVHSIGATGDYTSLQAWEDAAPADLVAADQRWIGECQDQIFDIGGGVILTIAGSTADATRYKYLRCGAGASWKDKAGVRSTAYYPNTANGTYIRDTGGGYGPLLSIGENGVKLEGLQIVSAMLACMYFNSGSSAAPVTLDKCMVVSNSKGGGLELITNIKYANITNNLLISTLGSGGGAGIFGHREGPTHIAGNTIIALNDHTASRCNTFLYNGNVGGHFFTNNAFFGWNEIGDDPIFFSWSGDYNATDSGAVPWGTHNQVSLTFADQFENTTNDFRAKSTGGLHHGNPDSTYLPTDATGLTRDATTPWIGAWELSSTPTYTATSSPSHSGASLSGSATFTKPTYTGTAALTHSGAAESGTATFTKPTYTASASVQSRATLAALAQFTKPSYTASGTLGPAHVTLAALSTFTKPIYAGVGILTSHAQFTASAIFTPPTVLNTDPRMRLIVNVNQPRLVLDK